MCGKCTRRAIHVAEERQSGGPRESGGLGRIGLQRASMPAPSYEIVEPSHGEVPVVVEVPHAGLWLDPESMALTLVPVRSIARDSDLYADELAAETPANGATLLLARASRYVVDLNRGAEDYDGLAVRDALGSTCPRGVVWRLSADDEPVFREPIARSELERRLERFLPSLPRGAGCARGAQAQAVRRDGGVEPAHDAELGSVAVDAAGGSASGCRRRYARAEHGSAVADHARGRACPGVWLVGGARRSLSGRGYDGTDGASRRGNSRDSDRAGAAVVHERVHPGAEGRGICARSVVLWRTGSQDRCSRARLNAGSPSHGQRIVSKAILSGGKCASHGRSAGRCP